VEENLLQMARNEAIDKGGDTVVKGNSLNTASVPTRSSVQVRR